MSDSTFQVLYKRLNKAQKQAVDAIEGPVMVIAGPGTGKTSILTLRIAQILQTTDTKPDNILALTFTESGAYTMRKKLVEIIGTSAYKVAIHTFHGFCNEVIKQYPERFPRIIGSTAITEIDQIALIEEIMETEVLDMLKPFGDPLFYVRPVLGEIRKLKREAISPDDLKNSIHKQEEDFENEPDKIHSKGAHKGKMKGEFIKLKTQIDKNKELYALYRAYEEKLIENKYYDFEDMIVEVVKTLKSDPELLLILQETYQYILADEHQDANNAQNAILELLSNFHPNPNLFIVGDEKQAIFRFQGASLDNFLYFKKLYPQATLIHLEENYRSTQAILDASHSLSKHSNSQIQHVKLVSQSKSNHSLIQVHELPDMDTQHFFVAEEINKKIATGIKPEEICILYRNNNDSFAIVDALERLGITYTIESDTDILQDIEIKKLLKIFESINNLANEELLSHVLLIDFIGLEPHVVYNLIHKARNEKRKLFEVVIFDLPEISEKLNSWASLAHNKPFLEVFEIIIKESGYLSYILQSKQAPEHLGTLEIFAQEVKSLAGSHKEYYLKDFIVHLDRVRDYGILTKTTISPQKIGVRLMTAHRSKGLEFDYVYIIGAYDGHWGNRSQRNLFHVPLNGSIPSNGIDDERRLFYVALTRARKEVIITYPNENLEGKELLPTQFIGEIDESLKHITIHKDRINLEKYFTKSRIIPKTNKLTYIRQLFSENGLSVTSLNNYLECPWKYFFVNLIRIPQAQSKHQMYGTAIHYTLKTFFDKYRIEEDMTKDEMLSLFEFNLNKMPMHPKEYESTLAKGKHSLGHYFDFYNRTWHRNLLTEYTLRGVHIETDIGLVPLRGTLDKIEIHDSGVHIVDYKTGKPRSKVDEKYVRQLVFYKLLLELDESKKFIMTSGELDFIEPDDKGRLKKISYEVTDAQVKELVSVIRQTTKEIYDLTFWDKKCQDKDCEYCTLGQLIQRRDTF